MKWFVVAAFVVGAACAPAWAQDYDLGGTTWTSIDEDCGVDSIEFSADGTAMAYDAANDDQDSAEWILDGNELTIRYDNWFGGIVATLEDDGTRIEGTETWQNEDGDTQQSSCVFEIE